MDAMKHKACFGTMFPDSINVGECVGKVFTVRIDHPAGMMRSRPNIETDIKEWDDCRQCSEYESCCQLCMARIALDGTVAAKR
ncbi:hypothetical protein RBSWK_05302 [Rhodopirellula baltica SWK14]|uniref:Uncharacterized protein n=1 Tax=Rhodopirellula baltica SWK14 TaxID=993516 RepID=L7CCA7_RHOBT|nr:hypothetical protein RBSWK_05302 [Rhodopirellula baltica SWK14]